MKYPQIALVYGGISREREVSIKTGEMIREALQKDYSIREYDPKTDLKKFWDDAGSGKFDLVFPALHGPFGEDGKFQGLLEMLQLPYVFSDPLASALAMDKHRSKILVQEKGISVPQGLIWDQNTANKKEKLSSLGFPLVIKPLELGSSVGISMVESEEQLEAALEKALSHNSRALVEEHIKGRELTVTILGNDPAQALPVIEIKVKGAGWFDYEAKYQPGATEEVCPADIPEAIRRRVQDQALKAFRAIGCRDLARADFIWDKKRDEVYFLEINTIPGMTQISLVPQAARAQGIGFRELLDKLITMAGNREKYVQSDQGY